MLIKFACKTWKQFAMQMKTKQLTGGKVVGPLRRGSLFLILNFAWLTFAGTSRLALGLTAARTLTDMGKLKSRVPTSYLIYLNTLSPHHTVLRSLAHIHTHILAAVRAHFAPTVGNIKYLGWCTHASLQFISV